MVLKATNVDGVYDADPKQNPNARLLDKLSYYEVTSKDLSVMDMTAITLCQENDIPGSFLKTSILKFLIMSTSLVFQITKDYIDTVHQVRQIWFRLGQLVNRGLAEATICLMEM